MNFTFYVVYFNLSSTIYLAYLVSLLLIEQSNICWCVYRNTRASVVVFRQIFLNYIYTCSICQKEYLLLNKEGPTYMTSYIYFKQMVPFKIIIANAFTSIYFKFDYASFKITFENNAEIPDHKNIIIFCGRFWHTRPRS